jgi:hypothetical protein
MKFLAFPLTALFLTACCPAPLTKTQIVEVPVVVKCKAKNVAPPELPYDALSESATLFEKTRALLIQNYNLKAYSTELKAEVEGCSE